MPLSFIENCQWFLSDFARISTLGGTSSLLYFKELLIKFWKTCNNGALKLTISGILVLTHIVACFSSIRFLNNNCVSSIISWILTNSLLLASLYFPTLENSNKSKMI